MKKSIAFMIGILLFAVGISITNAQLPTTGAGPKPTVAGGGCSDSATFLARGSFDAGHTTAYQNFICGLNTDSIGIFSNAWDVLVILGTQNETVAALNLSSTSFSASPQGTTTGCGGSNCFTADRGYTGVDASSTVYINTNFRASRDGVNYTQNSAHAMVWSNTNVTSGLSGGTCLADLSVSVGTRIFPKYNDGNTYADVNVSTTGSMSAVQSSSIGQFFANRSASNAEQYYYNASSIATASTSSATLIAVDTIILASSSGGAISFGCGNQISAYSLGRSLNSTEVTNFYNRMRTLGTALGWT